MVKYWIKEVTNNDGQIIYYNYGFDRLGKTNNTILSLSLEERIQVKTYNYFEFEEYKQAVNLLCLNNKAKYNCKL